MNKTQKRKVFMYCRKSSEGEDKQMLSIPSQIKELKEVAKNLNLQIIETFEESKSAKAPGRPKFNKMMERIYKKEVGGILCWKLDRLARNPIDGGTVIWAVKDNKTEIITNSQTFSYNNENTLLMYVEFGMAQKFIDDLGKNVKRGLKAKAEQGWYPEHAPLGYKNTPDRKKGFKIIENNEEKFPLVKRLFNEILSGKQASQAYREAINKWKLTGKTNKPIAQSTFYNILSSTFYYGEYEYPRGSGIWHEGKHEPMITREEFDVIQKMLGKHGKPITRNHNFDLTGLIRCQKCDSAITATKKVKYYKGTNRTVTYIYYHCTKKNPNIKCDAKPMTEKDLVKQINELLLSLRPDEAFIKWAKKWLSVVHNHESSSQENILKSQQKALTSVENRLNRLLDMHLDDLLDEPAYKLKKRELESQKQDIKGKLKDTDSTLDNWRTKVENTLDFAYTCQKKFESGTRDEKHEVMTRISSNLFLNSDKKLIISLKNEFKVLADKDNWEEKYADWLEPQEYTEILGKNPELRPAIPTMLPG